MTAGLPIIPGELSLLQPLWLLTLLPVWLLLWQRRKLPTQPPHATGQGGIAFHPLLALIPESTSSSDSPAAPPRPRNSLRWLLNSVAISLLIIALAEPVRIGQRLPDPPPQHDIAFIVDSSVAMVLRDYSLDGQRLDRMSLLKALLTRFIDQLQGERMAVIVYGEHAYTLVPPSPDPALLRAMVERIQTTMAGRFSATGEAIALALRELNDSPSATPTDQQTGRHRVLILLSAGGTPTGDIDAIAAAQLAREQHIPLYTVIIGAAHADAAEQRNSGLIYRPAGIELLNTLAEITDANSFTATDSDAIEQALQAIRQRESRPQASTINHRHQPLYLWHCSAGCCC